VSDTGALVYRTGERANSELAWVDRSGAVLSTLGPPGIYKDPALSVDGRFVAYSRVEDSSAAPDVWMMNLLRPAPTRLTFGRQADAVPIWSPDGARLVYAANRGTGRYLYVRSMVDDTERELWRDTAPLNPSDWSPDGKVILFDRRSNRQLDTMQLALDGEARAAPFLQNPKFNEWLAVFSPDGRWVAYDSNESGERNVYVRSFAGQGRPERISPDGGTEPRWRRDGKELFYRAPDGRLMAVEVQTGASFSARQPHALFNTNAVDEPASVYSVAADGQRFLMVRSRAAAEARPITVVLNWAGLLRQ
jgi:Tol biopolymer transport system component